MAMKRIRNSKTVLSSDISISGCKVNRSSSTLSVSESKWREKFHYIFGKYKGWHQNRVRAIAQPPRDRFIDLLAEHIKKKRRVVSLRVKFWDETSILNRDLQIEKKCFI